VLVDTWRLSTWYLELSLLHLLRREPIPRPASGRRLRRRDHACALAAIPSERDTGLAERHRPKSADADCNVAFGEHNRDWEFIHYERCFSAAG